MSYQGKGYEGGRKLLGLIKFFGWVLLVVATLVPFIQESFGVHFLIGILAGIPYVVTAVGLFALVAVGGAIFDIAESNAMVAHRAIASPNEDAD